MRIVLCDDQPDILQALRPLVKTFFGQKQAEVSIESYQCLNELMASPTVFDLAFLDIELPDGSGLQAAAMLRKRNANTIIFIVTSHQHYLDDAMELCVFRYISKPIDPVRFEKNLEHAWKRYCTQAQTICIGNHGESIRIFTQDILYISIKDRGTELVTLRGHFESTHDLGYWSKLLNQAQFAQPHYSYLVNLRHVISLKKQELTILKRNDEVIKLGVSQRMYQPFKKAFFAMMGGSIH